LHCSDSSWGDAAEIDRWHRARGWKGIGYHYVILNGRRRKGPIVPKDDGFIEVGRREDQKGAHAKGWNKKALGVCLIGRRKHGFTGKQMDVAIQLVADLCASYALWPEQVLGHCEVTRGKTCPDVDMTWFRQQVRDRLGTEEAA